MVFPEEELKIANFVEVGPNQFEWNGPRYQVVVKESTDTRGYAQVRVEWYPGSMFHNIRPTLSRHTSQPTIEMAEIQKAFFSIMNIVKSTK